MRKYLGNPETLLAPTANEDSWKLCMQTCDSTDFSISKSAALYPHSQTFQLRSDFCYVMKKILKICTNPTRQQRLETAFANPDLCRVVQEAHQRHCVWKSLQKVSFFKLFILVNMNFHFYNFYFSTQLRQFGLSKKSEILTVREV